MKLLAKRCVETKKLFSRIILSNFLRTILCNDVKPIISQSITKNVRIYFCFVLLQTMVYHKVTKTLWPEWDQHVKIFQVCKLYCRIVDTPEIVQCPGECSDELCYIKLSNLSPSTFLHKLETIAILCAPHSILNSRTILHPNCGQHSNWRSISTILG